MDLDQAHTLLTSRTREVCNSTFGVSFCLLLLWFLGFGNWVFHLWWSLQFGVRNVKFMPVSVCLSVVYWVFAFGFLVLGWNLWFGWIFFLNFPILNHFWGFAFPFSFSELCILVGILLNARMKNLLKSLHWNDSWTFAFGPFPWILLGLRFLFAGINASVEIYNLVGSSWLCAWMKIVLKSLNFSFFGHLGFPFLSKYAVWLGFVGCFMKNI